MRGRIASEAKFKKQERGLRPASVHPSTQQLLLLPPAPLQGWDDLAHFCAQWALIFTSSYESHSNTNNVPGKFVPSFVPTWYPDMTLTLEFPARAVPPYASRSSQTVFDNKHQAQCFCSTICDIWGAVVLWAQLCSNEHILQLSVGHGRCNYRAAQGISGTSTVMESQHSDIRDDKFCGCKQQRLAENLDTGV